MKILATCLVFVLGLSGYLCMATRDPNSFPAFCLSFLMPIALIMLILDNKVQEARKFFGNGR